MARLPYPEPDSLSKTLRQWMDRLPPLNLFRMLAHTPTLLQAFVRLGNALLTRGRLDPALRELIILRVGHLSEAPYEIYQHTHLARSFGVGPDKLEALALADLSSRPFEPDELAALRYADQVLRQVRADQETFDRLRLHFEPDQTIELTLLVGYYMMVCRVLETLEIDLDAPSAGHLDL